MKVMHSAMAFRARSVALLRGRIGYGRLTGWTRGLATVADGTQYGIPPPSCMFKLTTPLIGTELMMSSLLVAAMLDQRHALLRLAQVRVLRW